MTAHPALQLEIVKMERLILNPILSSVVSKLNAHFTFQDTIVIAIGWRSFDKYSYSFNPFNYTLKR